MNHLIIIPTYNEALTVEKIISVIFENYDRLNILIVDDNSPDKTAEVIKELQKKYDRLHLLLQEKKGGLATAYINGMKWGIQNGFDVFSSCDADFSHNPKYFKDIIEYLNQGYDIITGSRYIKGGKTQETNFFKNFISIGGNIYTRLVLGFNVFDWTAGFTTYTKETLEKIDLSSIKSKGYVFQAEMKYKAIKKGCRFKEFPIEFEMREKGESKMSLNIVREALVNVLKIRLGF